MELEYYNENFDIFPSEMMFLRCGIYKMNRIKRIEFIAFYFDKNFVFFAFLGNNNPIA